MNSRNLFYVRNLQTKFYFKKNEIVRSLFFLENYLFNLPNQIEENLVIKVKLKWIYEQIKDNNYTNEITLNLKVFRDLILQKKILNMIELFSDIIDEKKPDKIFSAFKKFNSVFNSIIAYSDSNFVTSDYFQFFQYIYKNNFQNIDYLKKKFLTIRINTIDSFEYVFVKVFFKSYILKKKKPSKTIYLFYLLICFFKK